jgi:hypothetical protein
MFLAKLTDHIQMKIAKETKKNGNTKRRKTKTNQTGKTEEKINTESIKSSSFGYKVGFEKLSTWD